MTWRRRVYCAAWGAVELSVILTGGAALARRRRRGDTLILTYHNVVPTGGDVGGDSSLHLPQRTFAAQLDSLRRTHDVVPLDVALECPTRRRSKPRAVITIDDAYRGALTVGVAELTARSLPATIFAAPEFVTRGSAAFWWDEYAGPGSSGLDPRFRERVLYECRGDDAAARALAAGLGLRPRAVPDHARGASEPELLRAAAQPGISVAPHGWSHRNLPLLRDCELAEELERPLSWLRHRFDNVLPVFSYPYGHYSPEVRRAAERVGYAAAVGMADGWIGPGGADRFALPRMYVAATMGMDCFTLRTAGLFCHCLGGR